MSNVVGKQARAEQTRTAIIDAALALFSAVGAFSLYQYGVKIVGSIQELCSGVDAVMVLRSCRALIH